MTSKRPAPSASSPFSAGLRRYNRIGLALSVLLFGSGLVWASLAQLSGAVVAPGMVVVDLNVKKVQHPFGGIVRELLVRDGEAVEAGQILLKLDETSTRASAQILRNQLAQFEGRQARLQAEISGAERLQLPQSVVAAAAAGDREAQRVIEGEMALFVAARNLKAGERYALRERIAQLSQEVTGLGAQLDAKNREVDLVAREREDVEGLYAKKLIPVQRLHALRRDEARLAGERGALIAQIASTRGKMSEIEIQIVNLSKTTASEATRDLRETEGKLAETLERLTTAEDQLRRIDIRAPVAGMVNQLAIHTQGGVIQAGETLMLIVPKDEPLTIEARIPPADIEPVRKGVKTLVRFPGLPSRTTPTLEGLVDSVSADLVKEPNGQTTYYIARIVFPAAEMERLAPARLIPGMPAEAYIQTPPRTALSYLLKPLEDNFSRAMKER